MPRDLMVSRRFFTASEFVYNSAFMMKPIFAQAKSDPKRIAYAEGEDLRVLRAVQIAVDEDLAKPILVGRTAVIEANIKKLGLRLEHGVNITIVDQEKNPDYELFADDYYTLMQRKGVTPEYAQREARRRSTLIASMLVKHGKADGMLAWCNADFPWSWKFVIIQSLLFLFRPSPLMSSHNLSTLMPITLFFTLL
jgi:malate dehydrogenase (oxaloacetate-decarboxylating)(NADP+)